MQDHINAPPKLVMFAEEIENALREIELPIVHEPLFDAVRNSGVVVEASDRKSIGAFEPPDARKVRYRPTAAGSPLITFSAKAVDAVNEVAYWKT